MPSRDDQHDGGNAFRGIQNPKHEVPLAPCQSDNMEKAHTQITHIQMLASYLMGNLS